MKLLLDTHVLLWALRNDYRLPDNIKDLICDINNEVYISTASLWEIALKHKKHPQLMGVSAEQIRNYSQRAGYIFLSINLDNIVMLEKLDFQGHQDPFDQILISQSACNNMKLITHDEIIKRLNIGNVEYF